VTAVDRERVRAAIDGAERETTGRVAVHVMHRETPDALESAREHLHRAELHKHPHRNAIIFLVAPKSRRFAVYGDEAIHKVVGESFWQDVVAEMTPYFKSGDMTAALERGIARAGEQLKRHFPRGEAS
jgi:uncharacterized membrane protein